MENYLVCLAHEIEQYRIVKHDESTNIRQTMAAVIRTDELVADAYILTCYFNLESQSSANQKSEGVDLL